MSKDTGYSVVLGSGKKVLLREPKISHRNLAAQAVGQAAGDSQFAFVVLLSQQMLRLLIHSIDDRIVSPIELLDLDSLFTAKEYSQLEQTYKMIVGEDKEAGPFVPKLEIVPIGNS